APGDATYPSWPELLAPLAQAEYTTAPHLYVLRSDRLTSHLTGGVHIRLVRALSPGGVRARSFNRERGGHHDGRRLRHNAAVGRHGDDDRHPRRAGPVAASPHHHRFRLV